MRLHLCSTHGKKFKSILNLVKKPHAYIENPTDLVITDLFMPEKDGVEVVRSLTKHDPNVKILAMSGGDSSAGRKDVLEDFGVKRTFGKPFKIAEVLAAAEEVLLKDDE